MYNLIVSGQGEGSLILLLEHNNQRTNMLNDYHGLTKEKERVKTIFIDEDSHWLMET